MKINSSQRIILANQALYSAYSALTFSLIIPFALVLGISNTYVGLIHTVQYVAIMLSQIPGECAIERYGRKMVYLTSVPLSRLFWIGLVLLPFYFDNSVMLLLTFFFMINFFQYFAEPAYVSLVSDVVPERVRGWFFGLKNNVQQIFDTIAFLIAGYYLDFFPKQSTVGFVNVMLVGLLFGVIAAFLLSHLKENRSLRSSRHSLRDYFRLKGNLRRFIIFTFLFNFSYALASPFFTVYMLNDLSLNYSTYVSLAVLAVIVRLFAQPHIGRVCDRYGDRSVAWLMVMGTAMVPLLFFFVSPGQIWLIIIAQIIAGFVWAGVELALFNILLGFTSKRDRSFQTSAYILFTALPIAIAPLIGGWIADNVVFFVGGIPLLFLLSAILRLGASFILLLLPELRAKRKYTLTTVFLRVLSVHPERSIINGARFLTRAIKQPFEK